MSRILKATERSHSPAGRFTFQDWDSPGGQSAELGRAADELLENARREADQIRAEAREAGLAAAMSEFDALVEQAAQLKFEAWLPALRAAADEIAAAKAAWLAEWERGALRVATAIAERVLRRELERAPEVTLALVREALELATGGDAELHLHPADISGLGAQLDLLLAELGRAASVTIVPDAAISRGGCRLDTRLGSIDQQLAAQLARIEEELR